MVRSRLRALVATSAVSATVIPVPVAATAPPYLAGTGLFKHWGGANYVASTATCDASGTSTISYELSTTAPDPFAYYGSVGPYSGTWKETATFVIGPQNLAATGFIANPIEPGFIQGTRGFGAGAVLSATVQFEIFSPDGYVSGTKTYTGSTDAFGVCVEPDGQVLPSEWGPQPSWGFFWGVRGTFAYEADITSGSG